MGQGTLGKPYRIVYSARNFKSGLSGITAKVFRPTGALHGNYSLTEISEAGFEGRYYFDIPTSNDVHPEGEYIISINSPNEGDSGHKATAKVTLSLNGGGTFESGSCPNEMLEIELTENNIELDVSDNEINLDITDNSVELDISDNNITMNLSDDEIEMNLDDEEIELEIGCCQGA